jgi:hypothetical protein
MKLRNFIMMMILGSLSAVSHADSSVGCGLGSLIFKDTSLISSSLRVTTNNVFLTQYLGVTSGTSGCTRHSIVQNEKSHIHFAEVNFKKLSEEMAKGEGQYLQAFAFTLGCKENLSKELGRETKTHFENIIPDENVDSNQMLKNLGQTIRQNSNLSKNCSKAFLI